MKCDSSRGDEKRATIIMYCMFITVVKKIGGFCMWGVLNYELFYMMLRVFIRLFYCTFILCDFLKEFSF